jgi:hypothetical protein
LSIARSPRVGYNELKERVDFEPLHPGLCSGVKSGLIISYKKRSGGGLRAAAIFPGYAG